MINSSSFDFSVKAAFFIDLLWKDIYF